MRSNLIHQQVKILEQTNDFEVDLIESLKTLKNEGDGKAKETSKYIIFY